MPLAADYPLLEIFWTIALIALWAVWIWTVVWVLIDTWRRVDHGAAAKTGWTLFVILVPLLGVLTYVIVRPRDIEPFNSRDARPASQADPTEQLQRLADLRDKGVLTEEQFQEQKHELLG